MGSLNKVIKVLGSEPGAELVQERPFCKVCLCGNWPAEGATTLKANTWDCWVQSL